MEIRVRADGAYRLMHVAKFAEAIYVLHVFQKKTRKTSPRDIGVARARLLASRYMKRSRMDIPHVQFFGTK